MGPHQGNTPISYWSLTAIEHHPENKQQLIAVISTNSQPLWSFIPDTYRDNNDGLKRTEENES